MRLTPGGPEVKGWIAVAVVVMAAGVLLAQNVSPFGYVLVGIGGGWIGYLSQKQSPPE